jgi:hypothetical protein
MARGAGRMRQRHTGTKNKIMRSHLQTPEQALLNKHYAEVCRLAWNLRKITGHGQLRLAMLMGVPEALRSEVEAKIIELQHKHNLICKD